MEDLTSNFVGAILDGSPAVGVIFAFLWWQERAERIKLGETMTKISEQLLHVAHLLNDLKERVKG